MAKFMDRLKSSFNVLTGNTEFDDIPEQDRIVSTGSGYGSWQRSSYDTNKSVLAPILNRISIDAASIPIRHVKVDEQDHFVDYVESELDDRLTLMANVDQTGKAFVQDAVETMLEEGACAIVPVDVARHPRTGHLEILSARVGTITEWRNRSVVVSVYNDLNGQRVDKLIEKDRVAIAYNPLHSVMNEPNSTLKRYIDRLALLDITDGKAFSPQLDLIFQLPYTVRGDRLLADAEKRADTIEKQLTDSKYGIAWIDANERVTQLNRPVSNELFNTVESLSNSLYSQLGLTPNVFTGNASPEEMVSYNNRTIFPILTALTESMTIAFFSRTAIRQGHRVRGIPNVFKMVPLPQFAESADKLSRNEIVTSNELRSAIGMPPSSDPEANSLRNKNLNKQAGDAPSAEPKEVVEEKPETKEQEDG